MIEPQGQELIARYRAKYGISLDTALTEAQILEHWRLERHLTRELLESTPRTRWETFERCYSELYRALPWLREGTGGSNAEAGAEYALWSSLLGPPPCEVYEVGSGDGSLAHYLAAHGYRCRATEITRERGDRTEEDGLTWGQTDGVNLDMFETPASFSAVISDQVVEHLHPSDMSLHLRSARRLLRPGGRIVFATPHLYTGPHDISGVFDRDVAEGMHLREYTYRELTAMLREAGFTGVCTPLRLPTRLRARFNGYPLPILSCAYLRYLIAIEGLIVHIQNRHWRQAAVRALRAVLFTDSIVLVAHVPYA